MSWHHTAKSTGLAVEVNVAVVRRRTAFLPGEISTARGRESGSAGRSNALGDGREVSRGHTSGDANRGAEISPFKLRNPQARSGKGRTGLTVRPGHPPTAMNPTGGARNGYGNQAEKERPCGALLFRKERQRTLVTPRGDLATGTAVLRTRMAGGEGFLLPTSAGCSRALPAS